MIELRWFQTGDGHEDSPIEITLQFRTQVMHLGNGYRQVGAGDGGTYVLHEYQRPMGMTWTEWENVPVVDRQGTTRSWGGSIKT